MIKIDFINQGITVDVTEGTSILDAARAAGILLEAPCNAIGTCGKCKVRLLGTYQTNIYREEGRHRLSADETRQGFVLACQTKITGDLAVATLEAEEQNKTLQIHSSGKSFRYSIDPEITKLFDGNITQIYAGDELLGEEQGDTSKSLFGLVIDIGTTTLVAALVDLLTGEELAVSSALNPQSQYAQDVLTRIHFASEDNGLRILYQNITQELNRMIESILKETGVERNAVYEVIYSGNTTMVHLALNISPESLGTYPYKFEVAGGDSISAKGILNISPWARIYIPPVISAYVGPDITSGILAAQLFEQRGTVLFIDIGTNGEMAISTDGTISATSTAAGPAFEGMNISCGMRAGHGAIELFAIDEQANIEIQTIGDAPPIGLCGSGLLDVVGELVHIKAILSNGTFVKPEKAVLSSKLAKRLVPRDGKTAFHIADHVYLTQKDIRQVQLAKGAIRAGIEALLRSRQITPEQVDSVLIAGSFGHHLRESSLIHLGLLPKAFQNKVTFVGNTSKSGGKAFLLNRSFRQQIRKAVKEINVLELANRNDFNDLFVSMLQF